jgi:glycerol-3-phosphate dehydrogenase
MRLVVEAGNLREVEFVDEHSGEKQTARGKVIVNAAGPWVDQVLNQNTGNERKLIGGTKGSHIIVAPFAGAAATAVYVEAAADHRPFFIIPWNGNYLIGTTDIRYEDDLDRLAIEQPEVDYLLTETNRVFPQAKLTRNEILYSYSGVRPLPFVDGKDEKAITRRHFIREHRILPNLISVVGGKLTTYRNLSEQCVDLVFQKLGRRSPECATADVPLPGAIEFAPFAESFRKQSPFSAAVNNRLLRIYGSRASEVVQLSARNAALAQLFNKAGDALAGEVVFSFERELAQTLSDCLLRRTMIGLNSDLGIGDDEIAADIGKKFLGWNDARTEREIAQYRNDVKRLRV